MTPSLYDDIAFSREPCSLERARRLTVQMEELIGRESCRQAVYMGRVGFGSAPAARLLRLPLTDLLFSAKSPIDHIFPD